MSVVVEWRGAFTTEEANALHADAFGTRPTTSPSGTGDSSSSATASDG